MFKESTLIKSSEQLVNILNITIKSTELLFRASRDGDADQFHNKSDNKGATVTLIKCPNGNIFGG